MPLRGNGLVDGGRGGSALGAIPGNDGRERVDVYRSAGEWHVNLSMAQSRSLRTPADAVLINIGVISCMDISTRYWLKVW